jgi:hypothetical protein
MLLWLSEKKKRERLKGFLFLKQKARPELDQVYFVLFSIFSPLFIYLETMDAV